MQHIKAVCVDFCNDRNLIHIVHLHIFAFSFMFTSLSDEGGPVRILAISVAWN